MKKVELYLFYIDCHHGTKDRTIFRTVYYVQVIHK